MIFEEANKKFDDFVLATGNGYLYYPAIEEERFAMDIDVIYNGMWAGMTSVEQKRPFKNAPIHKINGLYDINAKAMFDKKNHQHFISINIGLVKALNFFFNYMMTNPNFLPEIGSPAMEIPLKKKLSKKKYLSYDDVEYQWGQDFPTAKSVIRKEFANHLLTQALLFCSFHEFGHISGGHLDFLNKDVPCFSLEESYSTNHDHERNLWRQEAEMDADFFAISRCMLMLRQTFNNYNAYHGKMVRFFSNEYDSLRYFNIAVFCLLKLFEGVFTPSANPLASDHHSPELRQLFMIKGVTRSYDDAPYKVEKVRASLKQGILELEDGLEYVFNEKTRSILNPENLDIYRAHYRLLLDSWPPVKADLDDYSYHMLPMYMQ